MQEGARLKPEQTALQAKTKAGTATALPPHSGVGLASDHNRACKQRSAEHWLTTPLGCLCRRGPG